MSHTLASRPSMTGLEVLDLVAERDMTHREHATALLGRVNKWGVDKRGG